MQCPGGVRPTSPFPYIDASLMNFFRPGGLNPSIIGAYASVGDPAGCIPQAMTTAQRHSRIQLCLRSAGHLCRMRPLRRHGCQLLQRQLHLSRLQRESAQALRQPLRVPGVLHLVALDRRFDRLAINADSAGQLLSRGDRSTSLFDQRHRFVFSGVYQTGKLAGMASAG